MNKKDEIKDKQLTEIIEQKVLNLLSSDGVIPLYEEQLLDQLDLTMEEEDRLHEVLDLMVRQGKLVLTKKKKYAIPEDLGFLSGRLQGNAKGFGFFIPDNGDEDVYISAENLNGAG